MPRSRSTVSSMKKLPVQFRCYAEYDHDADHWVAACIDLCIAAQADSLEAAKKSLHAQVLDYLDDAAQAPTLSETLRMLNRRAPFSEIAKYHLIKLCLAVGIDGVKRPTRYKEVARPQCFAAS